MRRFWAEWWPFCGGYETGRAGHPVGSTLVQAPRLEDTLRSVIAAQLAVPPDSLTVDRQLDDLGLDDDLALQVLQAVENELDVRFPDDFFDGLQTYGEFSHAVRVAVRG